jgi:hypothetical protein
MNAQIDEMFYYLALNADKSPKHPLYLKGDLKPIPF